MTDRLPPAILLGGETIAVSAARSLGRSGVEVIALGAPTDPVRWSRHCARFAVVVAKPDGVERYLDWLSRAGPRRGVVMPCDDDGLALIARHRAELVELGYRTIESDADALATMLDKDRTYALCRTIGVPVPRTAVVRTRDDAERAAADFAFPCALKPLESRLFAKHFGLRKKVFVVQTRSELLPRFEEMLELGIEMLVTEIVPGPDDSFRSYYSYLDGDGQPLFHFTKGKMRQYPIHFGLATYQMTTWTPEVAELGLRVFQSAGLRGPGNVEFKRDARDGSWRLIECNARPTAATEQVRKAGIDIPLLAYNRVVGRPDPPLSRYRLGVHYWAPLNDTRAMLAYRRAGELTAREWLRTLRRRPHFPMLSADDPMPTLRTLALRVRRYARKRASGQITGAR